MLATHDYDQHRGKRAVGEQVPAARRGPGAQRVLLMKVGRSWLKGGWALAGGCRGPFGLNTPTGRAARSRAAHQPAGVGGTAAVSCSLRSRGRSKEENHAVFYYYSFILIRLLSNLLEDTTLIINCINVSINISHHLGPNSHWLLFVSIC